MSDGGLYGYLGEGDTLLAEHAGLPPEGVRAPHWCLYISVQDN